MIQVIILVHCLAQKFKKYPQWLSVQYNIRLTAKQIAKKLYTQ